MPVPDAKGSRIGSLWYISTFCRYTHLVVNIGVQLVLGVPLEMVHKWWRVQIIYFAGVIAGSLAHSITDPSCRLAGASGGVYSLLTAHIACAIMVRRDLIVFNSISIAFFRIGAR